MNTSINTYEITASDAAYGLSFFFVSRGKLNVIKVVNYAFVERSAGKDVYNLGFGDFDLQTGQVIDSITTENGDTRKVFNTVLRTIPMFFEKFADAKLIVKGSDSREGFKEICYQQCRKNCTFDQCRIYNQRIRIYSNFIDRNLEVLSREFQFFGGFGDVEGRVFEENYVHGKEYIAVAVLKRKL